MKLTRVITAALLAGSVAAPAFAGDDAVLNSYAHTGSKGKIKVTLYGQVNPAMIYIDDGLDSEMFFAMNDASSDRLGLKAKGKIDDKWSGGAKIEYQFEQSASDKIEFNDASAGVGVTPDMRKLEFWLENSDLGKISLGLGDMASNGSAESDLSGTKSLGYANVDAHLEDVNFVVNGVRNGAQIEDFIKMEDGHSRQRRVRYDTPSIAGFTASAAWGWQQGANNNTNTAVGGGAIVRDEYLYDVALRYAGEVAGMKVKAAAAHAWNLGATKNNDVTDLSVSVLSPMGLNFTAAWEGRDRPTGQVDSDVYYTKLGYQTKELCDWGKTSFAAEYSWSDDFNNTQGNEGTIIGLGVVQKVKALNSELYLGWRRYEAENAANTAFEDIDSITIGGKVKL
ncbi:MAG: porin [Alphaproteobacteria bacterium]